MAIISEKQCVEHSMCCLMGEISSKKGGIFAKNKILQSLNSNSDLQIKNTSNDAVCQ